MDNIPVLSWVVLGGRCRACRAPIAIRYPLVEVGNGLLWAAVLWRAPSWADFASGALLCSACLALAWIDADFQLLPDAITLPGIGVGLALSFWSLERTPARAAVGAALGGGGLYLVGAVYRALKKVEGMGLGDVKMLAMVGAFLGPSGVVVTVLLASLSGSLVGLALIARGSGGLATRLPFGVFLAAGAVASYFFGGSLLQEYRSLWP
jgi:leader peptidase (prepilin peptidase)/N-methyltransferase